MGRRRQRQQELAGEAGTGLVAKKRYQQGLGANSVSIIYCLPRPLRVLFLLHTVAVLPLCAMAQLKSVGALGSVGCGRNV